MFVVRDPYKTSRVPLDYPVVPSVPDSHSGAIRATAEK